LLIEIWNIQLTARVCVCFCFFFPSRPLIANSIEVGTCGGDTVSGGTQMNFNRPANLLGACPQNSRCSGNGNCECNNGYCAVAGNKCQSIPKPPIEQYNQTVRVRKEWRALSEDERKRVGNAFSIMNKTDTLTGRKTYGKHFWNAQDLVVFHVCAVVDPRCDQAHFGPSFMTFHRAFLKVIENSLRAIDEEILAMPYWNMALDSETGIYNPTNPDATDPDEYIFSDKYFGEYFTEESENYVVTKGLFAYWSVPEWYVVVLVICLYVFHSLIISHSCSISS
jgi:hypothetical protein